MLIPPLLAAAAAFALFSSADAACSSISTRPSWNELSAGQKAAYVAAARRLYDRPDSGQCVNPSTASHLDFVECHWRYRQANHGSPYFWPWHRIFTRTYERALQSIDPSVVLPYADWHSVSQAPHLYDIWANNYFGGNGNSGSSYCMTSGTFAGLTVSFADGSNTIKHCFSRKWSSGSTMPAFYPSDTVMGLINTDNFWSASQSIEGGPHAVVHNAIGGEMPNMWSTADPVFFAHHGYVDRLWWYRQTKCPSWANAFSGTNADMNHVLAPYSYTVAQVMSTESDLFCYRYTDRSSDRALNKCPASTGPSPTNPAGAATKTSPVPGATSAAAGGATTTTSGAAATNTADPYAYWLNNLLVGLIPGVPNKHAKLLRREDLNSTSSANVTVIEINNSTVAVNVTVTAVPGTNMTVALPTVNGTTACGLAYVATSIDDVKLPTKYIPADYSDNLVPLDYVGNINYYQKPKKTVSKAADYEAAVANGDKDVVLVLDDDDTEDLDNLRHVPSAPTDWLKMNNLDLAFIRKVEAFANALVDTINITPGYTSPDALKNVVLPQGDKAGVFYEKSD
ncbi:hypothetical protein BJ742DRAFT_754430 [Cladochytrium replicatum]|nr:hypothetical protein BJ742DRAFT_754430 [Cladochytrium replicatum]